MSEYAAYLLILVVLLVVVGALGWARSQRRVAAQKTRALHGSEEFYKTIFQVTGTGMVSFGDDAVITLINDEFANLTGCSADEVVGKKTWMEFFSEESLVKMKRYHRDRTSDPTSAPRSYEAQLLDGNGRTRDGVVTIDVVPGTQQRIASFLDTTEVKLAQQQLYRSDKLAALGQIIAGVAHEINNPNNFIHFNLPILNQYIDAIRPTLDEHLGGDPNTEILNMSYEEFIADLYKLLDNMQHGSSRITEIVSELKTYIGSHESKGKAASSLNTVIHKAMTLVDKQVRKMVKSFDTEVAEGLPPVMMNAGRIEQVLINLLVNAGQAANKDDSWVRLTARPCADDDHQVEMLVEDNGAGIDTEDLPMIFDPFFSRKSRATGTGLGLAITQRIIEDHDGTIVVESTKDQGTCFVVRLPAIRVGTK